MGWSGQVWGARGRGERGGEGELCRRRAVNVEQGPSVRVKANLWLSVVGAQHYRRLPGSFLVVSLPLVFQPAAECQRRLWLPTALCMPTAAVRQLCLGAASQAPEAARPAVWGKLLPRQHAGSRQCCLL
jgi:hypothetical protein